MKLVRTGVLKIQSQPVLSEINAASASVWNECLQLMEWYQWQRGYPHAHDNFWIGSDCEGWLDKNLSKSQPLHSQSIQTIRKQYFKSWKSYWELKKTGSIESPQPPYKKKGHTTTRWLKSAIRFQDSTLSGKRVVLSMGKGRKALDIPLPDSFGMSQTGAIATIDLCYNHGQYELHFTYNLDFDIPQAGDNVMGIDIGEIHPIVCHDGLHTYILNGRYIRSLYRLRNKVLAGFQAKIDRCQRGSKQWWRLVKRKWKRINRIDNQIKDALHKHTATFVRLCQSCNVGTVAIGELTGIRTDINYSKRANQKLHQWPFAKLTDMIIDKCKAVGIKVKQIGEEYTSQTCPRCGDRHKPSNRNYNCKCGFEYHRDGVGAINIRKKYQGHFGVPVEAAMAPPIGVRFPDVALHKQRMLA